MTKLHWCPIHKAQPDKCCEKGMRWIPLKDDAYVRMKKKKQMHEYYKRKKKKDPDFRKKYEKTRQEKLKASRNDIQIDMRKKFIGTVIKSKKKELKDLL